MWPLKQKLETIAYMISFLQKHNLTNCTFFKCIDKMVDQYSFIEGLSDYQVSIFDSLIARSKAVQGGFLRWSSWQVELPVHSGRMSPVRRRSPSSTTASTSPPPSVLASGSWTAETSEKLQKWQRPSTRKPSMYLSWPSKFCKALKCVQDLTSYLCSGSVCFQSDTRCLRPE